MGEQPNAYADDLQVFMYNGAGITIGSPEGKINTLAFGDQNKGDRNQIRAYSTVADSRNIGLHMFSNQVDSEVPSFSVTDGKIGVNNAQPASAFDVAGDIGVTGTVDGVDIAAQSTALDQMKVRHVNIMYSGTSGNVGAVIPSGAYIESISVLITTPFTGGSSPAITIGTSANATGFASLSTSDIASAQRIQNQGVYLGMISGADWQAVFNISGSPTAGAATVVITTR